MNVEHIERIAQFFRIPATPGAVEIEGGMWRAAAASAEPEAGAIFTGGVEVVGLGATSEEAATAYQRNLVILAAASIDALRSARSRAHAFVLAADTADAAIGVEVMPGGGGPVALPPAV